jgi:hypothetical protein
MSKSFKKIIKESTETKIDVRTGEIVEITDRKEYKVPKEPEFVKMYLDDISNLMNLPNTDVLYCLLKKTNYDGEVVIIKPIAEEICRLTNLKNTEYFYKLIGKYCDSKILIKKCRGMYMFNPYYFAKGHWEDIYKIRLTVDYTPTEGRKVNVVEFIEGFENNKDEEFGLGRLPYLESLPKSQADKIIHFGG